jgi:hypothetical protein
MSTEEIVRLLDMLQGVTAGICIGIWIGTWLTKREMGEKK